MGVVGTLLKNRRAGEAHLAWNLPGLSGPQTMAVTSTAFGDGAAIPVEHAGKRAGGRNLSPELSWTAPPAGTAELLLVIEDVDAPMGSPFVHCVAIIDPDVPALDAGALGGRQLAIGVRVLRSTMGRGYVGPEPIKGHGPHRYVFQLFALGAPAAGDMAWAEGAKPRALLARVTGPVLGRGRLTGVYER
jgi:Raf kinase inhibitor-like YbhB/YbcL family protein